MPGTSSIPKRKLPNWLDAYLQFVDNTESPTSFHTWSALSCIAGALQRRVFFRRGHELVYPNQYIIIVGPSGRTRKGLPLTIARSFMEDLSIAMIGQDNSAESVIRDMKQSIVQFTDKSNGKIYIQCAVTCMCEELAVLTGYQNNTLLAYLTDWYDSRDKWTRRTKHQGIDEIHGMCFNLLASTAPDWLPHILPREAIGGGFTSRCMFVCEEKKKQTIVDADAFPVDKELRAALLYDLEIIHILIGEMTRTPEAKQFYEEWYLVEDQKVQDGIYPVPSPLFAGYASRRATHLMKISMALSAAQGNSRIIDLGHITQALDLMEQAEEKMQSVFAGIGTARFTEQTDLLLDYIRARKRVKRSEVLARFHRQIDSWTLEAVEKSLTQMKAIKAVRDVNQNETIYEWREDFTGTS